MKTPSEDTIQQSIYIWYTNTYCLKHHNPRCMIFSVPNGGFRNPREAKRLKDTGLLPGVSDLVVIHHGKVLFFEVKTPTGTQSPAQKDFQERIEALGFQYHLVRSLAEFQSHFTPCDTVA